MFLGEDIKIIPMTFTIDPVDEGNHILDVVALLEALSDILVFLIVASLAIVPDHNVSVHLLSIPTTNRIHGRVVQAWLKHFQKQKIYFYKILFVYEYL